MANPTPIVDQEIIDRSIQTPSQYPDGWAGGPAYLWFKSSEDTFDDIAPWWSDIRDDDLDRFTRMAGNDILISAISTMVKKFRAMSWLVTGPERVARYYQEMLASAQFGKGWGNLIGKTVEVFLKRDKGSFWELIGSDDGLDGPIVYPVMGIASLDSRYCRLSGDPEYPVYYASQKTGSWHRLHASRVVHFVDMPSPNLEMNDTGFCAVSRSLASSYVLQKLIRYKNEKLSNLPEAGILLFKNIMPQKWEAATADADLDRVKRGEQYWKGLITLFGLDPTQDVDAKLVSFANLPDHFNEMETVEIYINLLALDFGVDVREFWPKSMGSLGSGNETRIQHMKAQGKGIGELISMIERAINWKILPDTCSFEFDFTDDEEDAQQADINDKKVNTIMQMWKPPDGNQLQYGYKPPVSRAEIRQMLADNVSYFQPEFLEVDITEDIDLSDTEVQKMLGPIVRIDEKGRARPLGRTKMETRADQMHKIVAARLGAGDITMDDVVEFRLGQLLDNMGS